jgi:hypothetical protein
MTCEACGDELAGHRCVGSFHRTCVERLLDGMSAERGFRSDHRTNQRDST